VKTSHTFASGNRVAVTYAPASGLRMQWDRWPPSQADVQEWRAVRHDLIGEVLPPGLRFAVLDEESLGGCPGCGDD